MEKIPDIGPDGLKLLQKLSMFPWKLFLTDQLWKV